MSAELELELEAEQLGDFSDHEPSESGEDDQSKNGCPSFKFGDSYKSFEQLEVDLKRFEKFHYCKFWKREARTVEAAKKRVERYLNPSLKYYQLKYACIHGGQAFRPKGKGCKSTS